ncbi:MAG: acyl-CoA mutase large subunit family protein [Puniceicoccaceae bacterium]
MEKKEKTRLLSEFPSHTEEQWKEAAVQLLKGRPFERTLITPTYEGFDLQPIYTREGSSGLPHLDGIPGEGSLVRGSRIEGFLKAGWLISQELSAPSPAELNAIARQAVETGQTELNLWLDAPTRAGQEGNSGSSDGQGVCGASLATLDDLKTLLEGINPAQTGIYWQGGKSAPSLYALLIAALRENGTDLSSVKGCLGLDPIGWLVESGELPGAPEEVHKSMAAILEHAAKTVPEMQVLDIKGHAYHNAGASSTQEMAAVLATAVAYLKAMADEGVALEDVVSRMRFSLSVGGNYFLEIAKLRALRLLWSRIMDAFEIPGDQRLIHLHARTGLWNKTVFDPYVNMLRTTTEAFAAVVGGCDSLHVGHFDEIIRESDAFSRRIARNTHVILAEECDMRRVIDPAGGSWAVETLTDQMAAEAWKQFQEIEASGGILSVLESGKLQEAIEGVRQQKMKNIQRRKDVIVGTNAYPNAGEELLRTGTKDYRAIAEQRSAELEKWIATRDGEAVKAALAGVVAGEGADWMEAMITAAKTGATLTELEEAANLGDSPLKVVPLALQRSAEEFEKLRLAARAMEAGGKSPLIHQLNIGPSRRYRIRADWTSAFFQVGGLKVLNEDDYNDVAAALSALSESGASVAVITSDDETYGNVVEELARGIKDSNSGAKVIVAGAPGDSEAAWREAGVDDFVHVRVNNYQFNASLLEGMGASL